MYNLLQPHLDVLLFEVIFPLMCFNDNDQMLWEEDPHEYVRKGYGMFLRLVWIILIMPFSLIISLLSLQI